MVNLLQTQDSIMTALDQTLSLEDKIQENSVIGDSLAFYSSSVLGDLSDSDSEEEESESESDSRENSESEQDETQTEKSIVLSTETSNGQSTARQMRPHTSLYSEDEFEGGKESDEDSSGNQYYSVDNPSSNVRDSEDSESRDESKSDTIVETDKFAMVKSPRKQIPSGQSYNTPFESMDSKSINPSEDSESSGEGRGNLDSRDSSDFHTYEERSSYDEKGAVVSLGRDDAKTNFTGFKMGKTSPQSNPIDSMSIGERFIHNMKKKQEAKGKIDVMANLSFGKIKITVGEKASKKQVKDERYKNIIDFDRLDIPHIPIFKLVVKNFDF